MRVPYSRRWAEGLQRVGQGAFALAALALLATPGVRPACGEEAPQDADAAGRLSPESAAKAFARRVQPTLAKYCYDCHGADLQEGDVRLDQLNPDLVAGADAGRWHAALDMINQGYMPPEGSDQPSDDERRLLVDWMTESIALARRLRSATSEAEVRRLTREQYSNSLAALLQLPINFAVNLPDEARSKLGFTNSGGALITSPLHVEYFERIARQAVDKAIVTDARPAARRYRVTLGNNVGAGASAAEIGGYQSAPIAREHVLVEILNEHGQPRTPDDPQEAKALQAIQKNIGVGMRGSSGDRYRIVDDGMVLFSALPHKEQAPKSWQGPSPNLKVLLRRCFPTEGPFVTRVVASLAGFDDELPTEELLQLRSESPVARVETDAADLVAPQEAIVLQAVACKSTKGLQLRDGVLTPEDLTKRTSAEFDFTVEEGGLYHIDLIHPPAAADAMPSVSLHVDRSAQHLRVAPSESDAACVVTPVAHARLAAGKHRLRVGGKFFVGVREVVLSPLPEDHPAAQSLRAERQRSREEYERRAGQGGGRAAALRAFVGSRTDDGMDYAEYDQSKRVDNPPSAPATYEFHGYLENLPIPIVDEGETTALSNIMIVGVWNDHLVKNPAERGVPILVRSIEFEGPYYPEWPPSSHREVFFDSPLRAGDKEAYTREVLRRFLTRAFREPVGEADLARYFEFWRDGRDQFDRYEDSVKEALVAALCSPRFLYLSAPAAAEEPPAEAALAERLAYFLWNAPPDKELTRLAAAGQLRSRLSEQAERLIADPRVGDFVHAFATDWLRLDRHAAMDIDVKRYPDYTRFVKRDMALETVRFVQHVLQSDLSLLTFVDSDFAMLNQNLAEFYGVEGVEGAHFRPTPVTPAMHRGGLLAQGAFLAGHSDGVQAHPIKRAVWLKSKILGSPPPPPPPNVPELDPETPGFQKLTLKEQLELHRDKASCADCHRKIDPYGVVFENYDAVGRFQTRAKGRPIDSRSELPDGAPIDGVEQLKAHLLETQSRAVARSVVKHLYSYALGRDATFVDDPTIESIVERVVADDYRLQTAIIEIVGSREFQGHAHLPNGVSP